MFMFSRLGVNVLGIFVICYFCSFSLSRNQEGLGHAYVHLVYKVMPIVGPKKTNHAEGISLSDPFGALGKSAKGISLRRQRHPYGRSLWGLWEKGRLDETMRECVISSMRECFNASMGGCKTAKQQNCKM